ncbi:hypothetical protein V6N11_076543 [Hibiscus sabdariffa]|uniref:Uncharacterized protein n=1 Tax=Hibiscus sabdariffa TaxID=183260 RepID=A0ABR2Q6L1_9ROSI
MGISISPSFETFQIPNFLILRSRVLIAENQQKLGRLFGKPKQEANTLTTLDKLNETLEMLEKKEKVLVKKADAEVEKAKEFIQERPTSTTSMMST